jgi:hypothetical protein
MFWRYATLPFGRWYRTRLAPSTVDRSSVLDEAAGAGAPGQPASPRNASNRSTARTGVVYVEIATAAYPIDP